MARTLASRLRVRAADTDQDVEAREGRAIAAIFADDGEAHFRRLERDAVRRLLDDDDVRIVALGGGAFVTPEVRADCIDRGAETIYLHAPPDVLVERLRRTRTETRPLLTADLEATIRRLYAERDPIYRTATRTIETAGRTVEDVVREIVDG